MLAAEAIPEHHPRRLSHEQHQGLGLAALAQVAVVPLRDEDERGQLCSRRFFCVPGHALSNIARNPATRLSLKLGEEAFERGADEQRRTPAMHDGPWLRGLEHHAVIAEEAPSRAREREGERGLSAPAFANEHDGAAEGVDHAARVHKISVSLAQPEYRSRASERAARGGQRGAITGAANETAIHYGELCAVAEIAKARALSIYAAALDFIQPRSGFN